MARAVLPWVGAAIGSLVGAPQLGFAIGSLIGNVVDPMVIKAPSIGEGQNQTSQEGVPINRVYGTACCSGNVIARGDLKKIIKRTRQGKGGPVQEEERFLLTYAIGITGHKIGGILRIWEDEKLVYDVRPEGSQVTSEENVRYAQKFRLFLGTEDQDPSSDLEMVFGVGNTPAYSNRSYIVFPENDVTDRRGSIPNYRFEVTTSDVTMTPSLFVQSSGYRMFSGTPGSYQLLSSATGTGSTTYNNETCSTASGIFHISANDPTKIVVYRRDDTLLDWVVNQEIAWDFTSVFSTSGKVKVALSKSEKWLLIFYKRAADTTNDRYRLVVLPFDSTTGMITETPQYDMVCDKDFFSAPEVLADDNTKDFYGDLVFSPSGKFFTLTFQWGTPIKKRSVAVLRFDEELGEVISVNSKAKAPNPILQNSHNKFFIFINDSYLVSRLNRSVYADDFVLISYNINGAGNDTTDIDKPSNRWGIVDTLTIPSTGDIYGEGSITGSGMGLTPGGKLFIPLMSDLKPNESFPWTPVNFGTGEFGSVNYNLIPNNPKVSTTARWKSPNIAISGDGNYIVSYCSVQSPTDEQPGDAVMCVYLRNPISDTYDLIQTLTRGDIVSSGTTPYNNSTGTFIAFSGSQYFASVTGKSYLANIIKDVADLCSPGLDEKIDVSELEGKTVDGFVIAQQYSARNVISSLQQTHFFDPSEYDEKLNFIVRGKPVYKVITEQDLIDEDPWSQLRKSSIEYPKKLNLLYQNSISGYDTAKATVMRSSPSVQVSGEKSVEVPEVLDNDKAAQIADIQMKIAWAEAAGNFTFSVPASWYDNLVPSDIIALYLADTGYRLRIEKIDRADGELKIEASIDRQSAYSSFVSGLPPRAPTPPAPTIAGDMELIYLNIPALLDSNDVLGYYLATSGTRAAYTGGVVERRNSALDGDFGTILSTNSGRTVAQLLAPITASSEHYVDTTNFIQIRVFGDDFEAFQTISNDSFLRENNAIAIVNASGQAEIIQYRDAESLGNGEYKLTHLLRGRLNTTPLNFAVADKLAVLEDVHLIVVDGSDIGTSFEHRATAYGENPLESSVSTDSFAQPLMQTEFPVDLLKVVIDSVDATVTWSPRERFGSDINPIRSVNWTGYRITYDDGSLVETFDITEPMHSHDISAYSGTITISVCQLNRLTGEGPSKSVQVIV